jgi:hypothetical protein
MHRPEKIGEKSGYRRPPAPPKFPRMEFFFHIVDASDRVLDEKGMHLSDMREARREMWATAIDVLHQSFDAGLDVSAMAVEVEDFDGRVKARMFLREIFN